DTSMTLVANSLRGSETLSGYNCFTLDEGRTDQEFVCGSVSGTSVTSLERGISFSTGTTTVTANKYAHRKGADVKITEYPLIQRLRNLLNALETIPAALLYTSHPCSVSSSAFTICDKSYSDGLVAAGVAAGNTGTAGIFMQATGLQAASSTPTGVFNS